MSRRRARRVRRLVILTAAAAALAGGATLITRHRHAQREADLTLARHDGLVAYAAGDDALALADLERYVTAHPVDADTEALLAYAGERSKIEQPNNQHVLTAVRVWQQVLTRDGRNAVARRALLTLLPKTGDAAALDRAADDALARNPADVLALRARLAARLIDDRPADALADARACAAADPNDFDTRLTALRLMDRLGRPAADLAAFADAQFTPGDPRRVLLRAAVDAPADHDRALVAVRSITDAAAADPALARQAVTLFDQLGRPGESRTLLDAAARRTGDVGLIRTLSARLWQHGDVARLAAGATPLDSRDPAVLALRAAALYRTGRRAEAATIVARLAVNHDRLSVAYAVALPAEFDSRAPIAALEKAAARLPDDAVLQAWLGDALAAAGEPVLALPHLSAAATLDPAWPAPLFARAAALLSIGESADAIAAAQAAFDRAPTFAAAVDLIGVRFAAFDRAPDAAAARDLLDAAARVQAARPGEPRTFAVEIGLLARLGRRDEARNLLASFAGTNRDPAACTFVLDAADREGLGGERLSPTTAPATAAMNRDALPSIDSLRAIDGDDGRQWRLARAHALVDSHDPNDSFEAVTILGELVHETPRQTAPRLELARALERVGNPTGALEHLRLAVANDPCADEPLARFVGLLRRQGDDREAADALRRAATIVALPWRQRLAIVSLATAGGDTKPGIARANGPANDLLRPLTADAAGRRAIRQIARRDATTAAVATDLLTAADAAMPAVSSADTSAEPGESAAAWAVVGRRLGDRPSLDRARTAADTILAARPADADVRLLRAGLMAQLGRPAEAEADLRIVLAAEPDRAAANNDLACLLLDRDGDPAEAARLAGRAVAISPGEAAYLDTLARVTAGGKPTDAAADLGR